MHPALSVIFFSTLSGTGYGLWFWFGASLLGHDRDFGIRDYVTLAMGANDLPRAVAFYDALFGAMGGKRFMEHEGVFVACLEGEGFAVSAAANGHEALERWQRESPDLVCLDIMMPGIDGYEVCRRIRATPSRVPVVFLSAKNEEIDVVVGLELGADDFVRKPFGRHELLARIRSALRRSVAAESPNFPRRRESFEMGPLTIFPKELRAEREQK